MNERTKLVAIVAGVAALGAVWFSWVTPRLTRLPDDFHYEADIFSRDDFFDEKAARFVGEILSLPQFHYDVVGRRGDTLTIKSAFDVKRPSGETIFAVERLYGIDRRTGRHVAGAGDKTRDGYLFAPRGADQAPFTYWHVSYDAPARLTFQGEEDILGLSVYRYACDYTADQTASLGHLPGVPGERGVVLDVHLELWVEPASGWLVKYEDHATAFYYDRKTKERLHPWNRFRNQYTEASVVGQVALAKRARWRVLLAGPGGAALWGLLAVSWGLLAWVRRAGGAAAVARMLLSRSKDLRRAVALAAAVGAVVLGIAVMVGWSLGIPRLVQVFPGLSAMVFNTALGFCIAGLGLGLGLSRRRRLAQVSSGLVLALGLATLAEYFLGVDLGVQQLIVRSTLAIQTPHAVRMAPMTAACFVVVGVALFLHAQKGRTPAVGLLGSLVVAVGGAALLGYALGLPQAYRLGPWAGMALHTAAGFTVLGGGLVATAWPGWDAKAGLRWVAAFSGVGGLFAVLLLYYALDAREAGQVQRLLALEAARAAERAADRMNERIMSLQRMAERWQSAGGISQAQWEEDAATHVRDLPGFAAVSWVDPSSRVRWIVPWAPNEAAQGRDLSFEDKRRRALEEARRTHSPTVAGPIDLVQGGRGFMVCVPLLLPGGRFDGFITGAFRYDGLMDILLQEIAAQGHAVALWDGDEVVYRRGPSLAMATERAAEGKVRFQGGSWRLLLTPRPEWEATVRSSLPEMTLGGGLAVLTLASLSLGLAWQAVRQAVLLQWEVEAGGRREARFKGLLEGAPDAIVIGDAQGRIVMVNAQTERLFGYERAEMLGQPLEILMPDRSKVAHPAHREGYFAAPHARAMGAGVELYARRKDGVEIPVEISLSPLVAEEGVLAMSAIRDVAEQRETQRALLRQATELEEQRRAALEMAREKEVLLQEVHHRVKNNLQVISSLINMQARALADASGRDALEECQSRVQAIALIHDKLYQSQDYARVPFSEYARSLAVGVFHAAGVSPSRIKLELAIEEVTLAVSKAIPCGLILNELITNALKHAFPHGGPGTIRVELARVDGTVRLEVSDNGVGLPADLDVRRSASVGLQLVRMLTEQVDAQLVAESAGGARFRLTVPLGE